MSEEHHISMNTYIKVFIALMVLMVVTMLVPLLPLHGGEIWGTLLISTIKAVLIVMYFMHLKVASKWIILIFCSSIWALLMGFAIIFADYMTRVY